MTNETVKSRKPRSKLTPEERRKRSESIGSIKHRLVAGRDLDYDNYEYYFAVDDGVNIQRRYDAGWDIVSKSGESVGTDIGDAISHHSGKNENGSAQRCYLMRMPKELYREAKAKDQRLLDEQMNQLKNPLNGAGDASGIGSASHRGSAYIPQEGIKIS